MSGLVDYIRLCIVAIVSWTLGYFQPIHGIVVLFLAFFVIDFCTGLMASFSKGDKFRSWKARDSFFKLMIYLGSFAVIIAIGKEVSRINEGSGIENVMGILKGVIYVAIWFEAKSNAENLRIIFPENRYVRFLDYVLGVEFVKKLPWLKNFMDIDNKDGINRLENGESK